MFGVKRRVTTITLLCVLQTEGKIGQEWSRGPALRGGPAIDPTLSTSEAVLTSLA